MIITEVYFRSHELKKGQQWFEIFNDQAGPVNLKKAWIKKIDGKKNPKLAFELELTETDLILNPGEYAIIAQEPDLGQNLCSTHKVIVVSDKRFVFESSGVQKICVKIFLEEEACAQISDSKRTEKNSSRNLLPNATWKNETCEIKSGLFASPGLPNFFCQEPRESGWFACPEKSSQTLDVGKADLGDGCQQVGASLSELFYVILVLFLAKVFYRSVFCLRAK